MIKEDPQETLEDAIRHVSAALRIVYRYQYERNLPISSKDLTLMDELTEFTKGALRDMLFATRTLRSQERAKRPQPPTSRSSH